MRNILDSLYRRTFLSAKDLEKALKYFLAAKTFYAAEDGNSAEGLIAAGIVAYARPFSGNRPHESAVATPPFRDALLSAKERRLHDRIIRLRNTVIAHSDAERNPVRVLEYRNSGFLVSSRVYDPIFEAPELPQFIALSRKSLGIFRDNLFEMAEKATRSERSMMASCDASS
jgi:hypothetical protein